MRRWFIALLTLLVAAQLSWAGAALCCVAELGEHGGTSALAVLGGEQAHGSTAADAHPACDTGQCHCHHAGCATPLADAAAPAAPHAAATGSVLAPQRKSHIPAGLERPNWQRA